MNETTPTKISQKITLIKKWSKKKLIFGHKAKINTLKFDNRKKIFATASSDQTIRLWRSDNYKNVSILKGHTFAINSIFFSKKFPYVISGGEDRLIRVWDIEYNKILRTYSGHFGGILNFANHPIIDVFFSCSKDNTIRIWDLRTNKQIQILYFPSKIINSMIVNCESPHLVTIDNNKKLGFWDLISGKCYKIMKTNAKEIIQIQRHYKKNSFFGLSAGNLINWRNDGLILKRFKNILKTNHLFCMNEKNEIALAFSFGWIKIFNYFSEKRHFDFFMADKYFKKENKTNQISIIKFNPENNNLLVTGIDNSINIFKKNWKIKLKVLN
jgi:pleiotropic regulator 1